MKWEKLRFEELYLSASRNGIYKPADLHGSGCKIVNMGELFAYDFIGTQEMQRIVLDEEEYRRFGLKKYDLLFARRSLIESGAGKSSIVMDLNEPTTFESSIIRVRLDSSKCVPLFYHYWLRSHAGKAAIRSLVTGINVKGIRSTALKDIFVDYPYYAIQFQISITLYNYDTLIENNQKKIKLLEEAAQRLYKEWFVDIRFPGHETTPIVDGVPEGWTIQLVSDFGSVITGKTPSTAKKEYYGGNIPFVKIPDMHDCVYPIKTETALSETGAKTQRNKFIPRNSIMVSCIATVGLVNISIEKCQTNQQINSIILSDDRDLYYMYFAMKRLKELLEGVGSNGATMTNVNKTKFSSLPVLYPSRELRDLHYNLCKPIFKKIYNLSLNIEKLKNARDLLLPKLMSGEIEV